jgi:amidase
MVPRAHANDLGGSIRYPASCCGLFGLKPTRARNPLGPEYGEVVNGGAVEHAVTRTVRDSAALLDATSGPDPGAPYQAPLPARPFLDEVGADPGRLRIAFSAATGDGEPAHPDCLAALDDAVALCTELGHELIETPFPPITPVVGNAIGTYFGAAVAWIGGYWVRKLGREPEPGEIEPLTLAYWEGGKRVSAGDYLLAMDDLNAYSRAVARFFADVDVFLCPTLAEPPLPLGVMTSTPDDPLRAQRASSHFVSYSGVVANITGNPAMSVPLFWGDAGLPIGVHFLGRYLDEATLFRLAGQLEAARPWAGRRPPVWAG